MSLDKLHAYCEATEPEGFALIRGSELRAIISGIETHEEQLEQENKRLREHAEKVWCDCDCCKWQEQREHLEQLCREMFVYINHATRKQVEAYRERMDALGLLDGSE